MGDWKEIQDHGWVKQTIRVQAARCMDCGVPFCQSDSGCPLGNIIPGWNSLVFHGNWKEAYQLLTQTNNFPEFTGQLTSAQLNSTLLNSGQVMSCQVRSGQVRSGQVMSCQVRSGQVSSTLLNSGQVRSGQVMSGQVRSAQLMSGHVSSGQVR